MATVLPGPHLLLSPSAGPRAAVSAALLWTGMMCVYPGVLAAQIPTLDQARQLHREGLLREAEKAYRSFLATAPPAQEAASAHNNLCLAYLSLGDNQSALEDCREAVRLRRVKSEAGGQPLARGLNNLALVLLNLGQPGKAKPLLEEALQLNRGLADAEATVQNLSNLGTLAIDTGDYSTATNLFQEAQALATDHRDEPWAAEQEAVAKANQGVVLEQLGAFRQALDLYEPVVVEGALDPTRRANLQLNVAVLYRNLGDPVRAVRELESALEGFRDLNDTAGESNALVNLGLVYQLNLGRPEAAEEAYRRALELAGKGHQRQDEITAFDSLGRLLLELGRWQEAESSLRRGLALARESDDPEGTWSCLEGLGRLAMAREELPQAAQFLDQAVTIIESQRSRLGAGLLRAGYFGGRRSVYEGAVTVQARLALEEGDGGDAGAGARALELVQQAKARELLESLAEGATLPRPLSANEIITAARGAVLLELFVADGKLYSWTVLPGPRDQDAVSQDTVSQGAVSQDTVSQGAVSQDTVSQGAIRFQDLGPAEPILAAAAAVHRRLSGGLNQEGGATLEEQLEDLSARLLAPLDSAAWETERWIISADRVLRYLPFETLSGPDGRRLLEVATVSYLPSASSLAWLQRDRPEAAVMFAGFGSPRWQPRSPGAAVEAGLLLDAADLRPLPAAEAELERSAGYLGGRKSLHIGDEATEEAFRRAVTEGAQVVHLATHAVVRESLASGAAIVLSPSGDDDGLLRPEEITALVAKVDLTVLAACSTALDTAEDSRALSSLTGSLLAAGSGAVLATLWDVGDEATAAFMEQLYFRLGKGLAPAEALRETKLQFLAEPGWQDPSLWAAYVLLGNPAPIVPSRLLRWWLPSGLLIFVVTLGILARSRRGRLRERSREVRGRSGPIGRLGRLGRTRNGSG